MVIWLLHDKGDSRQGSLIHKIFHFNDYVLLNDSSKSQFYWEKLEGTWTSTISALGSVNYDLFLTFGILT